MRVDGYVRAKLVHSSASSQVYEAVRESDGAEVVLKRHLVDRHDTRDVQAREELHALQRVAAPGVPRALELADGPESPVLVLERMPGLPLERIIAVRPLDVDAWLDLGMQLAEALARVHQARILHRNLNPTHVLLDVQTGRASLIGFALATELGTAQPVGRSRRDAYVSLPYIAPEQTGRMNRGCDARSDLYALGATLYCALTGRPPFESLDPLELVHCHLARLPEAPAALRPEVPAALSALVLKLLRKQPEERYQSAQGLGFDLAVCREQWTATRRIDPSFALGSADAPDQPRFSPALHGRSKEAQILSQAYERARQGHFECILIRGEAGAGKTALVDQLRGQLTRSTYMASGKFDPGRDRPYDGWISVLDSLTQQLLAENDDGLTRWRRELRSGMGSVARALVDHVPDLAWILGETDPIPALAAREAQARLSLALQRMLQTCATLQHPLVLFLDDVQWSDPASLLLLEDLLSSDLDAALLIVLAQSDGGSTSDAAFMSLSQRTRPDHGPRIRSVTLGALDSDAVVQMLAETLDRTPEAVQPLARWIEGATGNSPLLIREFVEHIHERGLLRYEVGLGWTWDAAEIASIGTPENAIALLAAKIERVGPQTRAVLQVASCMGDEFDRVRLGELIQLPQSELERELYALCDAGLIVPSSGGFRFLHDRIREAAQAHLSSGERSRLHFEMGRLLLAHVSEHERDERVFEIVEQLDRGLAHLPEALRWQVVELNIRAGKRSLSAGAATTAGRYFAVALKLLRPEDSAQHAGVVFELHMDSAESAVQSAEYERALALLDGLERRPLGELERARVAVARIQIFALTKHPEDCTRYALAVLRELGVDWPLHPSRPRVWLALAATEWTLRGDRARRLPPAKQVPLRWIARLIALEPGGGAMSRSDARLPLLAACLALRCFRRHGYLGSPFLTLVAYALWSHSWLRSRRTRQLSKLTLEWLERAPDPKRGLRAEMQLHALLHPWLMPRREALAPLTRIAQRAEEMGDREYAYYARLNTYSPLALAGDPVPVSEDRLRIVAESARRASLLCPDEGERMHGVYRLLLDELSGPSLEACVAETNAWIATHPSSADPYIRTLLMLVLCVYGRHDLAFAQSEALGERLFRIVPFVHVADHTFLRGLAAAGLATDGRGPERRRAARAVRSSARRLSGWARGGPDFAHMALALEAETARLRRKSERSRALYQRAVQQARRQGFPHHAALVLERHASLLRALRRDSDADLAQAEAVGLYREWGALAKASALAAGR